MFHDNEAGAVHYAPALVQPGPVSFQGLVELVARLRNYFYVASGGELGCCIACDPAEVLPFPASVI